MKASDYLTGPFAIYLAEKCNCSYFVRVFNDNDDPNYPLGITLPTIENDYLSSLCQYIQNIDSLLVVDIHGCTNSKKFDCSIWHDNYNTCDANIIKLFENKLISYGISVDNGSEYLGGQVTRQASLFTNALQIEIKRKIRSLKLEDTYLLESFINSMEESIYETYDYFRGLEKVKRL